MPPNAHPPGRDSVGVQPEGDPGHDDEHAAGHVDGEQVVGELTLERQVNRQATVLAWKMERYIDR